MREHRRNNVQLSDIIMYIIATVIICLLIILMVISIVLFVQERKQDELVTAIPSDEYFISDLGFVFPEGDKTSIIIDEKTKTDKTSINLKIRVMLNGKEENAICYYNLEQGVFNSYVWRLKKIMYYEICTFN